MRKLLKFLVSTVVVIILLVVIAIIAIPLIVDPNDFKPQIIQQVEKTTGRELTLGNISLSVFPWLGVEIHEVALSNAPGFADVPFAKAASIEVRVELLPLLQKQLMIDTIVIRELGLNLARNAQGKTNWEDLAASKSQETPAKQPSSQKTAPPLAAVAISDLRVESARIHWRDEVKDVSYTLEQLNLTTDSFALGEPSDINLAFDFASSQPEVHGHMDFSGKVIADIEANHYQIQNTDLRLTAAGPALPMEKLALHLGADIDAFLAKQQLNISDFKLTTQTKGPRQAQLALTASLEGDLAARQYRLDNLQVKAQVKGPRFPQPLNATLTTSAMVDLKKETLTLQDLSLATLGVQLQGKLNGTRILTEPRFSGRLYSNIFNPRQVAQKLGIKLPPTADASVLSKALLLVKFNASPTDLHAPLLAAKLDESTLKGNLAVHNFTQPVINLDLTLDGIEVSRYLPPSPPSSKQNGAKSASYTIKQLNLSTDSLTPGEPARVKLAFDFTSSQPEVHGHMDFSGKVTADLEASHYRVQNTDLHLTAAGPTLPMEKLALHLGADIDAFLAKQQLNISDFKLTSQVTGPQQAQLTLTASLEGDLAARQYRLDNLQVKAQVKGPQFPQSLNATLATSAMVDLKKETLTLQDLSLAALGVQLQGKLNGTRILTTPHVSGYLVSNKFSPRHIAQRLAIELPPTADNSALKTAHLELKFSASPTDFSAPLLAVKLDESTLKGSLAVHNFAQPAIRFDLALDGINVDRYLPPSSAKTTQPAAPVTPAGGAAAGAGQVPLDTLQALNVSGTLEVGRLTVIGAHSENIRVTLNAKDGLIQIHPLRAELYQGVYTGDIRLDARDKPLKLAVNEKLTNVQVGPLLKDMMGESKLLGTANISLKLTATGATPEAIRRTLDGTAGFSFTDGAIRGFNIAQLVREAKARLAGRPLLASDEVKQTDFTMLQGTITATNGLLKNDDLLAKSPFLRVHGHGTADLVQETVDYQVEITVVKSPQGQGGKTLASLEGITIPVEISGTFTKLDYGINLEDIFKAKAGKFIDKNLEKGLNELLDIEPGKKGKTPDKSAPSPEQQLKKQMMDTLEGIF